MYQITQIMIDLYLVEYL